VLLTETNNRSFPFSKRKSKRKK